VILPFSKIEKNKKKLHMLPKVIIIKSIQINESFIFRYEMLKYRIFFYISEMEHMIPICM